MQFEFLGKHNNVKVGNGVFFTAQATTPFDGGEWLEELPITYQKNPAMIRIMNQDLLSKRLPAAWSRKKRVRGFVARTFKLSGTATVTTAGTFLRCDLPIEKYGPLWHGCRLVDSLGVCYVYVVYEATQKKLSCDIYVPDDLKTLKSMCLNVVLGVEEKSLPNTVQDYSRLPPDLQECLQKHMSPEWQMVHSNCFKTVKIWHANQRLCQEIEYDTETKKYHGKARMWDYNGHLVLELHFKQGRMHGSCKTSHDVNDPVSSSMFENGLPIGMKILHHPGAPGYEKTYYTAGSCPHRIRFRLQSFHWNENSGATGGKWDTSILWGLLIRHEKMWKSCTYSTEELRDFWDKHDWYHSPSQADLVIGRYVRSCECVSVKEQLRRTQARQPNTSLLLLLQSEKEELFKPVKKKQRK